jgi:hypothetical protein
MACGTTDVKLDPGQWHRHSWNPVTKRKPDGRIVRPPGPSGARSSMRETALATEAEIDRARQDPEFRQQLLAKKLDQLLAALTKLRGAKPSRAGKAESEAQIREGVDLAVKLSERLHALGPAAPSKARRG